MSSVYLYDHAVIDVVLDGLDGTFSAALYQRCPCGGLVALPGGELHITMHTPQVLAMTVEVQLPPQSDKHDLMLVYTPKDGELSITRGQSAYERVDA